MVLAQQPWRLGMAHRSPLEALWKLPTQDCHTQSTARGPVIIRRTAPARARWRGCRAGCPAAPGRCPTAAGAPWPARTRSRAAKSAASSKGRATSCSPAGSPACKGGNAVTPIPDAPLCACGYVVTSSPQSVNAWTCFDHVSYAYFHPSQQRDLPSRLKPMGMVMEGAPVCGAMAGELLPSGVIVSPISAAGLLQVGYAITLTLRASIEPISACAATPGKSLGPAHSLSACSSNTSRRIGPHSRREAGA